MASFGRHLHMIAAWFWAANFAGYSLEEEREKKREKDFALICWCHGRLQQNLLVRPCLYLSQLQEFGMLSSFNLSQIPTCNLEYHHLLAVNMVMQHVKPNKGGWFKLSFQNLFKLCEILNCMKFYPIQILILGICSLIGK